MDSVEHTSTLVSSPILFPHNYPLFVSNIKQRSKSPEQEKLNLIQKIRYYQHRNNQLQAKHQTLQNTICDLRNLLQFASIENEEYIKQIQEQNVKLGEKSARSQASLKYSHKEGNHLQNCAMFWREFIQ